MVILGHWLDLRDHNLTLTLEKRCRRLPLVTANILVIVTSRYLNKRPNVDRVVLPPHFTELVLWETDPELAWVKTYECTTR